MGNDVTVTEETTSVTSSGVDTDVTISADTTTVEIAGADQIVINQQATEVTVGYTTTTVEIDENATQITVVSPHYSAEIPFSTDISVPNESAFKSFKENGNVAFELKTQNANDRTLLDVNMDLRVTGLDIDIAGNTAELTGSSYAGLKTSSSTIRTGTQSSNFGVVQRGAEIKSPGTTTSLVNIINTTSFSDSLSHCDFITLIGQSTSTVEYLKIGVDDNSQAAFRNAQIIMPRGFGVEFRYSGNASFSGLVPIDGDGELDDSSHSLGFFMSRWYTIFSYTSNITTSDQNHKQDIATLDEKEQRVARSCKGLLRKYRLKRSVNEKGDNARIHFGIIAQDLKQAFADEGLDAHKYAMFCSNTWWEADVQHPAVQEVIGEDGEIITEAKEAYTKRAKYAERNQAPAHAEEVTQLGIRYDQLLAFIISAI